MKIIVIVLLVLNLLFAFQIVDEGSVLKVRAGENFTKYITLYNFSGYKEKIEVELILEQWPEQEIREYQLSLVSIKDEEIMLEDNSKFLYPVYIDIDKKLKKGKYIFWLKFSKKLYNQEKEGVKYTGYNTYNLPLAIEIM